MAINVDHNEIPRTTIEAKRWWRARIREAQKGLTKEYIDHASALIAKSLMELDEYKNAKTVMLYVSTSKEVATGHLMQFAHQDGKRVGLPLCTDTKEHLMEAKLWDADHPLVDGAYGLKEPPVDAETIDPESIDLLVLPCMSCDAEGNRLGHGAGYYDRYINRLRDDCAMVALCFEEILAEKIPTEDHDEAVDAVVTENNVYRSK